MRQKNVAGAVASAVVDVVRFWNITTVAFRIVSSVAVHGRFVRQGVIAQTAAIRAACLSGNACLQNFNEPYRTMSSYAAQTVGDINVYAKEKGAIIVDLRSDTFTQPSDAMRRAMCHAVVGDDVYGEDPTVNELEAKAAAMLGKEAALFVASGTMGNLIAIMVHCNERGSEAYCGEDSHTILHEQGGAAQVAGVTLSPIPNDFDGSFDLNVLKTKLRKDRLHEPVSKLVIVENPINGKVVRRSWIESLTKIAKEGDLKLHLDGARMWNAVVAKNTMADDFVGPFDSVTFCLSKGLGAPAGSILCGSGSFVDKARRVRKVLGGGMRQAGVLAAAGLVALDETLPMLKLDHARAAKIAKAIEEIDSNAVFNVDHRSVETNMIFMQFRVGAAWTAKSFVERLCLVADDPKEPKVIVRALALTDYLARMVIYRDITDGMVDAAIRKIQCVLKE